MPLGVYRAAKHASRAIEEAHETETAARARVHGEEFIAAIDSIRDVVPVGEPYLLIEEGDPAAGTAHWARYELAPRPVILIRGGRSARWLRQNVPAGIRWVVVTRDRGEAPRLYTRFDYLHGREGGG